MIVAIGGFALAANVVSESGKTGNVVGGDAFGDDYRWSLPEVGSPADWSTCRLKLEINQGNDSSSDFESVGVVTLEAADGGSTGDAAVPRLGDEDAGMTQNSVRAGTDSGRSGQLDGGVSQRALGSPIDKA